MSRRVIERVMKDDSFQVSDEPAAKALKVAKCVLSWGNSMKRTNQHSAHLKNKLVSEL